jgi:hypothetical protein
MSEFTDTKKTANEAEFALAPFWEPAAWNVSPFAGSSGKTIPRKQAIDPEGKAIQPSKE